MFKKILCPTDLGNRSFVALEKAVQIAHQFDSSITMLNIHDEFMDEKERHMLRTDVNKMKEAFKKTAVECKKKMKQSIHELHADDIKIDYVLKEGTPSKMIPQYAREHHMDLIVMATDGRDNVMDFVTGTISEHVINHATCPCLIIPSKK
jgi:nucleotide-binding universal stress UspA family protein